MELVLALICLSLPGCRVMKINKRPMGLDALLENQLCHLPKFQKLHIYMYSISDSGVEIELIFTL